VSLPASCERAEIRPLSSREFDQISLLTYEKTGIDLRNGKEMLVSSRLGKKIRELTFNSFEQYYQHVVDDRSGAALTEMIDALTTNYTSFFREPAHFDFLRQTVLPWLQNRDRISLWSAACSTGEEPYSLAFCLLETLGQSALSKMRILATDVSTRVLETARRAVYPAARLGEMAPQQLRQYVLRGEQRWRDCYLVKKEVRNAIEFRRVNLMEPFSNIGMFPVIFCRNVMIYFDRATQQDLVNRLAACLEPGGYLFVGHSESLSGVEQPLQYVRPAVYRKPESGASMPSFGGARR
jgi:chemotaxis protein methyltransferase CheR